MIIEEKVNELVEASKRIVYLPEHIMDVLQEYKNEYVVFDMLYKSIRKKTVDNQYKEQLDNIENLKKIKIHEFRHSHALECINQLRMDKDNLRKRLGHSSVTIIEKYYGHLHPSTEKSAIIDL